MPIWRQQPAGFWVSWVDLTQSQSLRACGQGMGQLGYALQVAQLTHAFSCWVMMTHRKSLMNQQVRRKKRIYGSIVMRLTRGKPPLGLARLKDAGAVETVHHTVYNIYLYYSYLIIK